MTTPTSEKRPGEPARTQDEILARLRGFVSSHDDYFGFRSEVLLDALDYEHAQPYLKKGVTSEQWDEVRTRDVEAAARRYLSFAIGKIVDHRALSAVRSVEKLSEFAWLMGRDDVVAAMNKAEYAQYGAPQVRAFAETLGWPWPGDVSSADAALLERMSRGEPCVPDCEFGCGR